MQTDKILDLQTLPFSRAGSRFLMLTTQGEDGGLYISISSASVSMFGGSGDPHEILKVEVMKGGQSLPFDIAATPSCLEVKNSEGYVRFAVDGYFLLVEGHGLTVHFSAKKGGAFLADSIKMTVDGALIPIKGVKMTFSQITGTQELIAPWDSKIRGSANPDLYLYPDEKGIVKFAIIDQTTSEEEYIPGKTVDECAAEAQAEFDAFCAQLLPLPAIETDAAFTLAYALWTGLQPTSEGVQAYCTNKVTPIRFLYHEQAVAALAFAAPEAVLRTICLFRPYQLKSGAVAGSHVTGLPIYEAAVPMLGLAAAHAVELSGFDTVDRSILQKAYDMLSGRANWWIQNRSDGNGNFFYAFRGESGIPSDSCFDAGEPVITPDLSAFMLLLFYALEKMSSQMGDVVTAKKWEAMFQKEQCILSSLWNGDSFHAVTVSGKAIACGTLSSRPFILGKLLPSQIAGSLIDEPECVDEIERCLVAKGLFEAGNKDIAGKMASSAFSKFVDGRSAFCTDRDHITPGANYSPAVCAALIALENAAQ